MVTAHHHRPPRDAGRTQLHHPDPPRHLRLRRPRLRRPQRHWAGAQPPCPDLLPGHLLLLQLQDDGSAGRGPPQRGDKAGLQGPADHPGEQGLHDHLRADAGPLRDWFLPGQDRRTVGGKELRPGAGATVHRGDPVHAVHGGAAGDVQPAEHGGAVAELPAEYFRVQRKYLH